MKILFVSAVNRHAVAENLYPPLWPAYLAAYLEQYIPDINIKFKYISATFDNELKAFEPDLVAISSVTQNYEIAKRYAHIAKKVDVPVIIGGMHITSLPESLTDNMDVGCIGEGEETSCQLI